MTHAETCRALFHEYRNQAEDPRNPLFDHPLSEDGRRLLSIPNLWERLIQLAICRDYTTLKNEIEQALICPTQPH